MSLVLYRVVVSNSHEWQNAVGISVSCWLTPVSSEKKKKKKRYPTVGVNSHRTKTRRCRYLDALVDCRLPFTWACSQLQLEVDFGDTKRQYESQINCKLNAHMPFVWVEPKRIRWWLICICIFNNVPTAAKYPLPQRLQILQNQFLEASDWFTVL